MAVKKEPLPESLRKPINVSAAQPGGLRKQLGGPPDKSDIENHIFDEQRRKVEMLDAYFGLDANAPNLPERRVKAIIQYSHGVPAEYPRRPG